MLFEVRTRRLGFAMKYNGDAYDLLERKPSPPLTIVLALSKTMRIELYNPLMNKFLYIIIWTLHLPK